jgi:fucose permease
MRRLYTAFVLVGVADTMLGPLMPGLESRWGLDDARGGLLFMSMFLASVGLAALTPRLGRRIGYRKAVALGLTLVGLGVAGCTARSWPLGMAAVAVYGSGIGMAVTGSNLAVAVLARGASARPLLWLNMCWSIGAVACPALVAGLGRAFLPATAAVSLAMALAVFGGAEARAPARAAGDSAGLPHFRFALLLFLYVGVETSVSGWVSTYATRSAAERLWAVLPSVFWAAILAGRAVAPLLLHRIRPQLLAPAGLGLGFAGTCVLLGGSGATAMLAGSILTGLGLAPFFPVVVAEYTDLCGGAVSGLVFSAPGLGGAALPPLVGALSSASGSLRIGLAAAAVCIPVLIAVHARTGSTR